MDRVSAFKLACQANDQQLSRLLIHRHASEGTQVREGIDVARVSFFFVLVVVVFFISPISQPYLGRRLVDFSPQSDRRADEQIGGSFDVVV